MSVKTLHGDEARKKLLKGIDLLADAVEVTLGPLGSTVMIQDLYNGPYLTKDGVTVAKSIDLLDPIEDMGVQLIKQSAVDALDKVGDGTTTTTVLTRALIHAGMSYISKYKLKPAEVSKEMSKYADKIVEYLKGKSLLLTDDKPELLTSVATISSNNDATIGKIIADLYREVGLDGIVKVTSHDKFAIETEISQGSVYENGYIHNSFVNNTHSQKVEYQDCAILILNNKLQKKGLVEIMEYSIDRPILLICNEIDRECLSLAVQNRNSNNLNLVIVTSPGFGETRKNFLKDIAILTGATILEKSPEYSLSPDILGHCGRIFVTKEDFTLIDAKKKDVVGLEVEILKDKRNNTELNDFDKELIDRRIAALLGKVALIKVGAVTELEARELKDRIDDAVSATAAALEEGILPGGGNALASASHLLESEFEFDKLIANALSAPRDAILKNAGIEKHNKANSKYFLNDVNRGCNALTGKIVDDLIAAGIVDPTKVTVSAVKTAFSIASTVLSTDCLIYKDFNTGE